MDESFEIPVAYKNTEIHFPATLLMFGYSHKIEVDVYDTLILFEPDEERNYRAIIEPIKMEEVKKIDIELLKAIAASLENILK